MEQTVLSDIIKAKAGELGYGSCGIIKAEPLQEYKDALRERIRQFPDSKALYEELFDLAEPLDAAPWAKSIVVCVRSYAKYALPQGMDAHIGKMYLFDRRLASAQEHADDALFASFLAELGIRTHRGGVAARLAAVKAGLGTFGNNNFLHTEFGSFVTIDTWMVDRDLDADKPRERANTCGPNCRKCIEACPTKALSAPHTMDRGKCIAQLSFYPNELYGNELVPEELRAQMGSWVYGCDVCQNVCPKNRKWAGTEEFPQIEGFEELIALENILTMDEETFLRVLQPRFWYIEADGLWIWKCNALRAMANSGEERYHPYIRAARDDAHEKVREMAAWACGKLNL